MTVSTMILGSLLIMSGLAQSAPPQASESFDLARLKIDQCPGERFDFQAGEQTKVGLCSKAGASRDEIAKMLESAIAQLESTDRMRPDARDQIVAQIRDKLVEVRAR